MTRARRFLVPLLLAAVATCTSKVPNDTGGVKVNVDGGPAGNGGTAAMGGTGGSAPMGPSCGTFTAENRCDVCAVERCCAQIEACLSNPSCTALRDCYDECDGEPESCYEMCDRTHAAGVSLIDQAGDCVDTKCADECTSSPEMPPPPDAGAAPRPDAGAAAPFPSELVGDWQSISSEWGVGYHFTAQGRFIYTLRYDNLGTCITLDAIMISAEGDARVEGDVLTLTVTKGTNVSADCGGTITSHPVKSPMVYRYRVVPGASPVLELTSDGGTTRYPKR